MMLKYLEDIVTIGIDVNANIHLPTKGVPLRSSLSPFFGALYLKELARTPLTSVPVAIKTQTQIQVKVAIHNRSCRRALDKVLGLRVLAVHPAAIQRYLARWAAWWHHAGGLAPKTNVER
jgi:hypothetical protein